MNDELVTYRDENRSGQTLDHITRAGTSFERSEFRGSRMRGARLARTRWSDCDLTGADLSTADLRYSDLRGVLLRGARLRGARLQYADLRGADLIGADLTEAVLVGARLEGAAISQARFDRADLRGARGVTIDANSTSGAKFSYDQVTQWSTLGQRASMLARRVLDGRWLRGRINDILYGVPQQQHDGTRLARGVLDTAYATLSPADLWFALKRIYTGPWLYLNLVALLLFLLPRLELGIARVSIEQVASRVQHPVHANRLLQHVPDAARERIDQLLEDTSPPELERVPLWWVLLGLQKGWVEAALSLLVLAYTGMRTLLTITVSQLMAIERDNGISPGLPDYQPLIWAHLCTRILMVTALVVFARDLYQLLQLEVTIQVGD
jgi:uncharacterized protein YjbI with pentapeptide repeats